MKFELKPCPFCGENGNNLYVETLNRPSYNYVQPNMKLENDKKSSYGSISRLYSYAVGCHNCKIRTREFETTVKQTIDGDIEIYNGKEEAVKFWNTRKTGKKK